MAILASASLVVMVGCSGSVLKYSEDGTTDTVHDPEPDTAGDTTPDPDVEPDSEPDTAMDGTLDPHADLDADMDADAPPPTPGFVAITPGTFTMGSPVTEPGRSTSETEHTVTLSRPFEIMDAEVTQGQFEALMGYNPSDMTSCGSDCPVEQVNWYEAAAYANALSADAGYAECYACTGSGTGLTCAPSTAYATPYDCPGYRLPTEAEWEYAARAGTTDATYNGTSTLADCIAPNTVLDPIAWFCGNSSDTTHAVGTKAPNAWDLFDMIGGVWEWCHDWYGTYPGTVTDPWGPDTGSARVKRGGSWFDYAELNRAAARNNYLPSATYFNIGLRLARSLP